MSYVKADAKELCLMSVYREEKKNQQIQMHRSS